MDKLKKKKMLLVMVGLMVAASLALCYITDWARGPGHPPNYQCEEKQCVKHPAPGEKETKAADDKISVLGIKVPVDIIAIVISVVFLLMAVTLCYAWYTDKWQLILLVLILFFVFCLLMRLVLPQA